MDCVTVGIGYVPFSALPTQGAQMEEAGDPRLSELTAEIVAAYVSHHSIRPNELQQLIGDIHLALKRAPQAASQLIELQKPAVPIKKSVNPDYVVCLEDGKEFRSLKRHLSAVHGLSPAEYRAKWGLPRDYPMAAPNYSKVRSNLAKTFGLGRKASSAPKNSPATGQSKKKGARSAPKLRRRSKAKS